MSTTGPVAERIAAAVLLALWNRPETALQNLLSRTPVPPAEVQRALDLLRQRQCQIEQTPTTIRLAATGLPCWRDVLEDLARRRNLRIARRVLVYSRTASTNDIAWQTAGDPESHGLLVAADEQTAGRGRMGHAWSSKPRQSILISVLLREVPAVSLDCLTLLAGLATARAIERAVEIASGGPVRIGIKWPNDLLIAGRKVAGILLERRANHVVLGIGINVAQASADFPPELALRATSIYQAAGLFIDRLRIAAALVEHLDALCLPSSNTPLPLGAWLDEWKARCPMLATRISAQSDGRAVSGLVLDVDPLRGLVLRDDAGATHWLSAQTTSLAS